MIRLRVFILTLILMGGFGTVLFRAFQLQVLPSEKVEALARRQLHRKLEIVGRRGLIKDRNGREMAISMNSLSVYANPQLVVKPLRVARVLGEALGLPSDQVLSKIRARSDRRFVWIERQLDTDQLRRLEKLNLKELAGVGVLPEYRREYPLGTLAAHLIGYSSIDGDGVEGVERVFNSRLRGARSAVELRRDARGRPIFSHSEQIRLDLEHGEDIQLTIDANLQYAAERALKDAVEVSGAEGGAAIVLDPTSGEVLALANEPSFDPNEPGASPASSRRNRAVTDPIEPGSVLKPFVVARALEDKIVTPSTVISAGNGFIKVGRHTIGEADKKHRYHSLSVTDLIRHSSNVATVVLSQKMGWERIENTYRRLGFGTATGIETSGESRGMFPKTNSRQLLERATMSFGHGIALTPVQVASAYATIANGGLRIKPRLVRDLAGDDAKPGERVFSARTSAQMRTILEKVVENEGTGVEARIESFKVAGKTGTAQRMDYKNGGYERGAYWSSFAGFVPSQQPRYVIYVMIDNPSQGIRYGGTVAAPAFAKIARAALQLGPSRGLASPRVASASLKAAKLAARTLAQDNEARAAKTPKIFEPNSPQLEGLALVQALRVLQSRGMRVEVRGEGERVAEQSPAAGEPVGGDRKVILRLR